MHCNNEKHCSRPSAIQRRAAVEREAETKMKNSFHECEITWGEPITMVGIISTAFHSLFNLQDML